jgi:hypothetical protein
MRTAQVSDEPAKAIARRTGGLHVSARFDGGGALLLRRIDPSRVDLASCRPPALALGDILRIVCEDAAISRLECPLVAGPMRRVCVERRSGIHTQRGR